MSKSKKDYRMEEELRRKSLITTYAIYFGVSKRRFVKYFLGFKNLREALRREDFRYHLERFQRVCEMRTENMLFDYDYAHIIKGIVEKEM